MRRGLKVLTVVAVLAVIAAAGAVVRWGYDQVFVTPSIWYAQVDNACVSAAEENGNDFPYHYELPAVSEAGDGETIGFDTARELREGAYLRLETLALRGVRTWEEVA